MYKWLKHFVSSFIILFTWTLAYAVPFQVTYLWHMHQPIYYPYESPQTTDANNRFNFSVQGVWDSDRIGAYQTWPKDAMQSAANKGIAHGGAQMSYSGSLAENNNNLWGYCTGATWDDNVDYARNTLRTSLDNPRLDTVGIAYHHSLMPLTCKETMKMQIRLHKEQVKELWDSTNYSKGFWPPECAFAEWMIPALVEEGLQWVIVDNGHLFRAVPDFPWVDSSSCRVNPADMQNPTSTNLGSTWVQLSNIWAPTKVLAPWAYQPHYIQWVNPSNGSIQKIIAAPAGRYEGNENARGGYGAFKPENVWGSHTDVNTDASHPMMILCHSDGDNYGMKNSDAWHGQMDLFLDMCNANADFDFTSVQDYLDMYPPHTNDVIHVEPGSWIGIDGGTPYFEKWLSSTYVSGENPDRWSWSVLVAAQNFVLLADSLENSYLGANPNMDEVEWGVSNDTARAWHSYLNGETSCYWYWDLDRANPWDGNVTRACNTAIGYAMSVTGRHAGVDAMGPSIFSPQRYPYNPGGRMWNESSPTSSNFDVWSYVFDVSGLSEVRLCFRADNDGVNPIGEIDNEVYTQNAAKVGAWTVLAMTNCWDPTVKGPDNIVPYPTARAQKYTARVNNQRNKLVDYFIEAVDLKGNTNRSDIMHVYVADDGQGTPHSSATFSSDPNDCSPLTVTFYASNGPLQGVSPVVQCMSFRGITNFETNVMLNLGPSQWVFTNTVPNNATGAVVYFQDSGGSTIDNNSNANWSTSIRDCDSPTGASVVVFSNAPACDPVSVTYYQNAGPLQTATQIFIHIGFNNWSPILSPDAAMTRIATNIWRYTLTPPYDTFQIDLTFNNGPSNTWDTNGGAAWHFGLNTCVSPPIPVGIFITNPASDLAVGNSTTNYTVQGTASPSNTWVGLMAWTNSLTGGAGTLAAANSWSIPGVSLAVGTNVITVSATNAGTAGAGAADSGTNSAYSSTWTNGSNGGSGWGGGWALTASGGSAGFFSATSGSHANMNIGSVAWGLWANAANRATAVRPFTSAMSAGQVFSVKLDNNSIDTSYTVGIGFQNASGSNLFEFLFVGGESNYRVNDSTNLRATSIPWSSGGWNLTFQLTSATKYLFTCGTNVITGELASAPDQSLTKFVGWNYSAGAGEACNFYLNDISLTGTMASGSSTSATVRITRNPAAGGFVDTDNDQMDDTWETANGLVVGSNDSDGDTDGDGLSNLEEFCGDTRPGVSNEPPVAVIDELSATAGIFELQAGARTTNSRIYKLYWKNSLTSGSWTALNSVTGNVGGGPIIWVLTNNVDQTRYYRTGARAP